MFLSECLPNHHDFGAAMFLQPNYLKANTQSISEHLIFCSKPFQFKELYACELGQLDFPAPKKCHFTYFFRTNTTFSLRKSQNQN